MKKAENGIKREQQFPHVCNVDTISYLRHKSHTNTDRMPVGKILGMLVQLVTPSLGPL